MGALRELADRLTAELAELRRPWWRRWLGLILLLAMAGCARPTSSLADVQIMQGRSAACLTDV